MVWHNATTGAPRVSPEHSVAAASAHALPKFAGECVVVVDDDPAIREVLTLHLEAAGLRTIALDSARALLDGHHLSSAQCIVSDIRMPGMDGLELQRELNRRKVEVPFVVVTAHGDVPLAVRAMREGAIDVLEKPFRPVGLLAAIGRALAARADLRAADSAKLKAREQLSALTARERQVFDRLAEGKASKVVALELGISQRTVDGHRAAIMAKLGIRKIGELVRLAMLAS